MFPVNKSFKIADQSLWKQTGIPSIKSSLQKRGVFIRTGFEGTDCCKRNVQLVAERKMLHYQKARISIDRLESVWLIPIIKPDLPKAYRQRNSSGKQSRCFHWLEALLQQKTVVCEWIKNKNWIVGTFSKSCLKFFFPCIENRKKEKVRENECIRQCTK